MLSAEKKTQTGYHFYINPELDAVFYLDVILFLNEKEETIASLSL